MAFQMMSLSAASCLLLLCVQAADAAPPVAILDGPSVADAGDDVFYDASQSEGEPDRFMFDINPKIDGKKQLTRVDDKGNPDPKGKRVRINARPGIFSIEVIISSPEGFSRTSKTLKVNGDASTPCPPPIPCPACPDVPPPKPPEPKPPEPTPIVPTPPMPPAPDPNAVPLGEFGIAPKVAEIVKGIVDANKMQNAKTLADAADTLAAQIAAGTVTDAQDVLVKFGEAIKVLQSPGWSAAAPKFSTDLAVVYAMNKAKLKVGLTGGIVDRTGWSTLVKECGIGVRAGAMLK